MHQLRPKTVAGGIYTYLRIISSAEDIKQTQQSSYDTHCLAINITFAVALAQCTFIYT